MMMAALQNETTTDTLMPAEVFRVLSGIGADEQNPELEEILTFAYRALAAVDRCERAPGDAELALTMVGESRQLLEQILAVFGPVTAEPISEDFAHQFEVDFELRHNGCGGYDNIVDLYDPMMVLVHGGCELLRAALGMLAGRLEHGMLGGQEVLIEVELLGAMYGVRRSLERSLVLLLEFLPIMRSPHELVGGWRSSLGDLLALRAQLERLSPVEAVLWMRSGPQSGVLSPGVYRDLFNSKDMEPSALVLLVQEELASNALLAAQAKALEQEMTVGVPGMEARG